MYGEIFFLNEQLKLKILRISFSNLGNTLVLDLWRMLETTVSNGAEYLRLQEEISEHKIVLQIQ